jgi:hypothetical protein
MSIRESVPAGKAVGRQAYHSLPYSAKVKNAWSYTSSSPHVFMAWCILQHRDITSDTYLPAWWKLFFKDLTATWLVKISRAFMESQDYTVHKCQSLNPPASFHPFNPPHTSSLRSFILQPQITSSLKILWPIIYMKILFSLIVSSSLNQVSRPYKTTGKLMFVNFNHYGFYKTKERTEILKWILARIPGFFNALV